MATANDIFTTTDKSKMDVDVIHGFLSQAYWCEGISLEVLKAAIENSLCFGIFKNDRQIGFARVISDYSTYAYLCDVFILNEFQGRGFAKKLMSDVMGHPKLQNLRRFTLATRDAHSLYKKYGFESLKRPEAYMEIHSPNIYKKK